MARNFKTLQARMQPEVHARAQAKAEEMLQEYDKRWRAQPLYSKLEDALTYQKHSEVCGCRDKKHEREWTVNLTITEAELRKLLAGLGHEGGK